MSKQVNYEEIREKSLQRQRGVMARYKTKNVTKSRGQIFRMDDVSSIAAAYMYQSSLSPETVASDRTMKEMVTSDSLSH